MVLGFRERESMPGDDAKDVTLITLYEDLKEGFGDLKGEVREGFANLRVALVTGFRTMPSRASQEEVVRLLRENNRLQEERLTQLDVRLREQHLEVQLTLRALTEAIGTLIRRSAKPHRRSARDVHRHQELGCAHRRPHPRPRRRWPHRVIIPAFRSHTVSSTICIGCYAQSGRG